MTIETPSPMSLGFTISYDGPKLYCYAHSTDDWSRPWLVERRRSAKFGWLERHVLRSGCAWASKRHARLGCWHRPR